MLCMLYFPTNETDRLKISDWDVVLGAPEREKIPCLMHNITFV